MRLSQLLISISLFVGVFASSEVTAAKLSKAKSSNGIIRLTDQNFDKVIGGPRDYSIALLLTADGPQYGCVFCRIVSPQYQLIASSWSKDHRNDDGVFFAIADIADAQNVYRQLGLTHAPNLWLFHPTNETGPTSMSHYDSYTFSQAENQLGILSSYFNKQFNIHITIHQPFKWDRLVMSVFTFMFIIAGVIFFYKPIFTIVQSKKLWTAVTLVSVLMFTAGHMFNIIRQTPYLAGDGRGGVSYFVGGHGNQIAVETQIIALVYAALAFVVIALITKAPTIKNPNTQTLYILIMSALILVVFSYLMSRFKIKNGGYPFQILNIF